MGNAASGTSADAIGGKDSSGKSSSRRNSGGSGRKSGGHKSSSRRDSDKDDPDLPPTTAEEVAARAQQVAGETVQSIQQGFQKSIKKLEDQDHPAAHFLDSVCGAYMDDPHHHHGSGRRHKGGASIGDSFYSSDDDEATLSEDDETTKSSDFRGRGRSRHRRRQDDPSEAETESFIDSDYDSDRRHSSSRHRSGKKKSSSRGRSSRHDSEKSPSDSFESEDDSFDDGGGRRGRRSSDRHGHQDNDTGTDGSASGVVTKMEEVGAITPGSTGGISKPLASSFAKRCYFTKSGIGKTTQHYEGLTLTGNVVLMLAAAMKLKGCPTICDEDLRRVEQTYPNQFSRLPDELLLSSGWRRISKYCHFSHKPIPDGIPFFRKFGADLVCGCLLPSLREDIFF